MSRIWLNPLMRSTQPEEGPVGRRDVRNGQRFERQDDDVFVQDVVVFNVGVHR